MRLFYLTKLSQSFRMNTQTHANDSFTDQFRHNQLILSKIPKTINPKNQNFMLKFISQAIKVRDFSSLAIIHMNTKIKFINRFFTFNLESRSPIMPVDRHRATRLAFEPPPAVLLAQHPIFVLPILHSWINQMIIKEENKYYCSGKISKPRKFQRNRMSSKGGDRLIGLKSLRIFWSRF